MKKLGKLLCLVQTFSFSPPQLCEFSWFSQCECLHLFPAMPELLRSAKLAVEKGLAQGRNESYIKQLSDYIIPALVEALHKVIVGCYFLTYIIY